MMDFTAHPDFLKEHGYCVYEHVFPDGKRYVGITKDPKRRWKTDGHGYDGVPTMRKAIEKVGWDNIEHNVIVRFLPRQQAQLLEKYLIEQFKALGDGLNQRGGGELAGSLYSKPIREKLAECRRCRLPGFSEFAEVMEMYSENEAAAYTANLIDYVIRTEVEGYAQNVGDGIMELSAWAYYMKGGICGKDVRTMPTPSQHVAEVINQSEGEREK